MKTRIKSFAKETDGAITVDWVVLSAVVIGLGFTTVAFVLSGNKALGGKVASNMSAAEVQHLELD